MEGRLSEDPEHPTDVALFLDLFLMVEWQEHPIATDFQERLPEVVQILSLEAGQEGSRRRQNRLMTPTVRAELPQSIALSCEEFKPQIWKGSRQEYL